MTPSPAAQPRRIDAPWLRSRALISVFDALEAGGFETRVVGGAVRDALLGKTVREIDLATGARPEDMLMLAAAAGLAARPTGIEHGTITIVSEGQSFEVTTLRRDVATDGRRAVVEFTENWEEDARRRDFTINALTCRRDGGVVDDVGGLADLDARRVKFIGDAGQRIREDYLRILRFFRFTSGYADGPPDAAGLEAATALRTGLGKLSAERIGGEMLKLLATQRAGEMVLVMQDAGIMRVLLGHDGDADRLVRLQKIESALGEKPDPLLRLAAVVMGGPEEAAALAQRLRLSGRERDAIAAASDIENLLGDISELDLKRESYRRNATALASAVRIAWAASGAAPECAEWRRRANFVAGWVAPTLPFNGADAIALGVEPGPRIGELLTAFERWWIAEGFPDDPSSLRRKFEALARDD